MSAEEHSKIHPPQDRQKYVRVSGAKANYAGRIDDRWLELRPTQIANGDWSPAFAEVTFGDIDSGFDAMTWEHREQFLRFVTDGNPKRPWSTAATGKKAARLDAAVAQKFGMDLGQAQKIIAAFEEAKVIKRIRFKGSDRSWTDVWWVVGVELPPDTIEIPF